MDALREDPEVGRFRIHWGQHHSMRFAQDYLVEAFDKEDIENFVKARAVLDPTGRFNNAFSKRFGLDVVDGGGRPKPSNYHFHHECEERRCRSRR